jgi:PAS domain S-box-containing protein
MSGRESSEEQLLREIEKLRGRLASLEQADVERRRAEESLRASKERHRLIVENISEIVYAVDISDDPVAGRVQFVSGRVHDILGYRPEEFLHDPNLWLRIIHPDDLDAVVENTRAMAVRKQGGTREYRLRHKQTNAYHWMEDKVVLQLDSHGTVVGLQGVTREVSERKRAEEMLRENAERLRTLSLRLLDVQELERRHLARELHDEIGQMLTALQLALTTSAGLPADQMVESLTKAKGMVKDLTARVRDLSLRLRPTMLDDLGLLPALLWHIERYTGQTGVRVRFEHRGLERRLYPPEVETAAYRIIQEALTNVARHAQAAEVAVRLWLDGNRLGVQVEDRGIGFDPVAVRAAQATSGLSGMEERATLSGGSLVVDSEPGGGTRVTGEFPVGAPEERRRTAFQQFGAH